MVLLQKDYRLLKAKVMVSFFFLAIECSLIENIWDIIMHDIMHYVLKIIFLHI